MSGAVEVYCEMGTDNTFGQSGGWTRIANISMRNNDSLDWSTMSLREGRLCCKPESLAPGCSSTTFNTQGVDYRKVCGKVIVYQYYQPNGFGLHKE